MFLSFIIVWILVANWAFQWINYDVPDWVVQQNFGLTDVFYRFLKMLAPMFLMYPMTILSWHWPTILIAWSLYLLAYWIKRLTRHLAYDI